MTRWQVEIFVSIYSDWHERHFPDPKPKNVVHRGRRGRLHQPLVSPFLKAVTLARAAERQDSHGP